MALFVGIDLCDEYITAYENAGGFQITVPAVIAREKERDLWHIGESAYRTALAGKGVLTDRLLSLLKKHGTSSIAGRAYTAPELMSKLIGTLLFQMFKTEDFGMIDGLCVSVKQASAECFDAVMEAVIAAGIAREKVSVSSHAECFIYYTMAQEKEMYNNLVSLFDLSDDSLCYYEMKVARGINRNSIIADGEEAEGSFHIDILKTETGSVLGDRLMRDAAIKYMKNGIYSSVLLTGKGFERTDWAKSFIELVCRKRRVIYEKGLFAIGAARLSEIRHAGEDLPYQIFCDTRIPAELSIPVLIGGRPSKLVLAEPGAAWYGAGAHAEVLPAGQRSIGVDIEPVDRFGKKRTVTLSMSRFPERPDRCTRVALDMFFADAGKVKFRISDMGFGEIFPATDAWAEENICL